MLLVEDGGEEEVHSSPPVRTPKFQLAVEQPWTGGQWNPPEKGTPCLKTNKKL